MNLFGRRGLRGFLGVWFAEIAGCIGFVFRDGVMGDRFFGRFRGWRQFFGCCAGFLRWWAWPASASTTAATTAAAARTGAPPGTARGGGQV